MRDENAIDISYIVREAQKTHDKITTKIVAVVAISALDRPSKNVAQRSVCSSNGMGPLITRAEFMRGNLLCAKRANIFLK